ncbi:MAG TPA: hypothetical protein VK696_08995 [Steroidobacteraceae bacterium]|jgi:hypothetical protein|nr:hypothetical protein [Steroidobacteraceae bacterium]
MRLLPAIAAVLWSASSLMTITAQAAAPESGMPLPPAHAAPCLGDGTGYVRARIRGALNVDLNWKDAQLECEGEARPDGSGLRVSFAGPLPGNKVLHLVFGVSSAREGAPGRELPTNLTVLLEGGRVFATRGDDKCTLDQLSQRALPDRSGARAWRIEAHGFCVAPANAVAGGGRILVSRFDFAGRIEF